MLLAASLPRNSPTLRLSGRISIHRTFIPPPSPRQLQLQVSSAHLPVGSRIRRSRLLRTRRSAQFRTNRGLCHPTRSSIFIQSHRSAFIRRAVPRRACLTLLSIVTISTLSHRALLNSPSLLISRIGGWKALHLICFVSIHSRRCLLLPRGLTSSRTIIPMGTKARPESEVGEARILSSGRSLASRCEVEKHRRSERINLARIPRRCRSVHQSFRVIGLLRSSIPLHPLRRPNGSIISHHQHRRHQPRPRSSQSATTDNNQTPSLIFPFSPKAPIRWHGHRLTRIEATRRP